MPTLVQRVKKIAKEEGFKSIEEFINAWISGGQTFQSLQEWLNLEKGMEVQRPPVWIAFRPYLTIPYSHKDQFWYKWNAIAKAKGFKDPKHMVEVLRQRKLCQKEMAEELGIYPSAVRRVLTELSKDRIEGQVIPKRKYVRKKIKYRVSRDKNGVAQKPSREDWQRRLKNHGFRSLKDAVWRLKKSGYKQEYMANLLGISARGLRNRLKRAGL